MLRHIIIVSEQRTANQTPYNTRFLGHVDLKQQAQTRLFTETKCKKYVVITL